ncbi:MAG: potassium channel family protein, partial [Bacteroidota bacterium]
NGSRIKSPGFVNSSTSGRAGSFNLENSTLNPHSTYLSLLYFSYTTLTTTGFGDIRPVGMWVREIVMIEQMIGVLYPVILIGKLVSSNTGKK